MTLAQQPTSPPETAAILTIEAASPGGVPALVDTLVKLLGRWGHDPTVYRAHFAAGNLSFGQRVAATIRRWRPRQVDERNNRTVIVPAPPLPLWAFYTVPHFLFGPLLGQHHCFMVASGSAHVALPLALRGIPYSLWVATLYEDELQAKQATGDNWARRVLNSPTWPLLVAQEQYVLRRAERVLALSFHTAERIKQMVPDAANRVETVLFPVDTRRFKPSQTVRDDPPYGRYLMLAARINDPRKNVGLLLRAFARVREEHPDLSLVLVGEDPNDAVLRLVRELGLKDAVIFGGIVPADELLRLYQGAALFCLPSLQEGLGIVVLEALACGTPVVTTRCGGPEGIVIDGETGRVVDELHEPAPYAAAILDLLHDRERLARMRARCAAFAADNFASPVVAEQLRETYEATQQAPRIGRARLIVAALWAVLVLGAYIQHQWLIHGPAIQSRFVEPLLGRLP